MWYSSDSKNSITRLWMWLKSSMCGLISWYRGMFSLTQRASRSSVDCEEDLALLILFKGKDALRDPSSQLSRIAL
ncbi:hypothetical protein WICPIJ_002949 [Wickerhamomyces pijperi]|uniref:Uncharacterized protein n=1 Tax=Wickerhamomyces pijperi TaxID=599730 RepID=A0A9P8QAU9_WICPI|nr:hypothetical protein WICPIJ_002949 [Wickerhamomyces pijperi]